MTRWLDTQPSRDRKGAARWEKATIGSSAVYSWTVTGTQVLTVTGANGCGEAVGVGEVRVLAEWPYRAYLPVVHRE